MINMNNGQLAIAACQALGSATVRNRSTINRDILLSASKDTCNRRCLCFQLD